jgi:hypothetical protein
MTTARDIVTRALQKIGAVTKNESPSADEASDGLAALNAMYESWTVDSLSIVSTVTENFSLTAGVGQYNIGPGATFNTSRPTVILAALARDISNLDYQLDSVSDEWFQTGIGYKTQVGVPCYINYNASWPIGLIRLWPVPDQAYTLALTSEKPLPSFATLDTVISLPNGWERALVYNLAMEIAPEYGQPVTPEVAAIARQSLEAMQLNGRRNRPINVRPLWGSSRYNIYVGQ